MLVLLDLFLHNKFFSTLQFLGNLLHAFLGRVYFSIPILHTSCFHLFECDLTIDLLVETEVVGKLLIHEEQYPNISFPNISLPLLPQLHTTFTDPFFHLGRPIQLFVQGFCGHVACFSLFAQRSGLDLSSLSIQTEEEWKQRFLCPGPHQFPGRYYDCQPTHEPPTVSRSNFLMPNTEGTLLAVAVGKNIRFLGCDGYGRGG